VRAMGEWVFFVCKRCKVAMWLNVEELIEAVNEHSGHEIAIMPTEVWDDSEKFAKWFKKLMGWEE